MLNIEFKFHDTAFVKNSYCNIEYHFCMSWTSILLVDIRASCGLGPTNSFVEHFATLRLYMKLLEGVSNIQQGWEILYFHISKGLCRILKLFTHCQAGIHRWWRGSTSKRLACPQLLFLDSCPGRSRHRTSRDTSRQLSRHCVYRSVPSCLTNCE